MAADSTASRVPISRIAITVPPDGWFRGIAQALFDRYRQALVDLGVAIFDVPLEAFLIPDAARIPPLVDALRAFRPECALGLPLGSYALLCRLPPGRDGWRPNLFLDVLDVPTICLWDHAPVELADQLLMPHPARPEESTPGADTALARVLRHPRLIHWSRDSGQTRIMKDLGYLLPDHLIDERFPPVLPGFSPSDGPRVPWSNTDPRVGFVGHVYQDSPSLPDPALTILADEVERTWLAGDGRSPLWDALNTAIALLPDGERRTLALVPEQKYYWHFAHHLICHRVQTGLRLKLLGAAGVPVACHGNLRAEMSGVPNNLVPVASNVPYGPELSALFARHPITIDILNPGFVEGYSHKQVHGFASGGFMLINRKQDFVDAFGDAGEAVSCAGADDIAAKVDHFLTRAQRRQEVGDAIRATIRSRFQLRDVLVRALCSARACMESMDSTTRPAGTLPLDDEATIVADLLTRISSRPQWSASVEQTDRAARICTGPDQWSYAAAIPIPASVRDLRQPHVRLRLIVETGCIGLAAVLRGSNALGGEQLVSPTARPVTVNVELPHEGVKMLIVRNTSGGSSRALVHEAVLCDRRG